MSDHTHFKVVCSECGATISQCRCMDPNKKVVEGLCDKCRAKDPSRKEQPQ